MANAVNSFWTNATDCNLVNTMFLSCGEDYRVLNKGTNQGEIDNIKDWYDQMIGMYGQRINYYVNKTNVENADNLYGESPLEGYTNPKSIIMYIDVNDASPLLSKYGLVSDDDLTAIMTISAFADAMDSLTEEYDNVSIPEPRAGDLIELAEFGNDRVNGRTGRIFQITQRLDEDTARINPLAGHYLWMFKAKRYDYTYEENAPREGASNQVIDDTFTGTFTGDDVLIDGNIDPFTSTTNQASVDIFDYSSYGDTDDVYGGYQ